ncbi:MAG TPA: Trx7/PDZ domain-containing (seleno)protein [Urbifossiella sp.]|nr:Trx7/PDZ domain-containing (seleno)protein [Urbifossiella sp.]
MCRIAFTLTLALLLTAGAVAQTPREKKVRDDKVKVEADGYWIYNNLPKAFEDARKTGKPLVVILRCIPCEECVKLDDNLVDKDPVLRPLLDKFVRVRVVSTNGLDLSLFQYDYDQSFAAFFLNADGTIYGRFGTRSHRTNWLGDVSIDGLAKALDGALELHSGYPRNKPALAAKRGPAPIFSVPEKFPSLGKYGPKLDYAGKVVQSCIHCHQIGDAIKAVHRSKKEPLPLEVLFPYPHPKSQGLVFDPKERATVKEIAPDSAAEKSGFKAGDRLRSLDGQPLLSIADVQWVLHGASGDGARIAADVIRDGKPTTLTLNLERGWRERDDISWRTSSWWLRRMATGGMKLENIEGARPVGVPKDGMALLVRYLGATGPHGAAKAAGLRMGDVIVAFDGRTDLLRETDVFAHALRLKRIGDKVAVRAVRDGKPLEVSLQMQE